MTFGRHEFSGYAAPHPNVGAVYAQGISVPVVVTDNRQQCRFTECATVRPVSCFHGDETMLYIDGDTRIECADCIPVCPVRAIYDTIDLPDAEKH